MGAAETESAEEKTGRKVRLRAATAIAVFGLFAILLFVWRPAGIGLWVKSLHIISVIAWMAGMLYLPRLFVYHSEAPVGSERSETFKIMEERLLKVIIRPAMIATWIFGLWLAWSFYGFQGGWLWAKIGCVLALSAVHGYFVRAARDFAADRRLKTTRHWRLMNEAPTVLMIAIVILVVVKPF